MLRSFDRSFFALALRILSLEEFASILPYKAGIVKQKNVNFLLNEKNCKKGVDKWRRMRYNNQRRKDRQSGAKDLAR